jgi:phage shock protein PspC (stress-responsive transcriptional regulator)
MGREVALVRPRHGKVVAGVCAAVAQRFGWSPTLVRVAFVISFALPGPQILLYVLGWALIPKAPA